MQYSSNEAAMMNQPKQDCLPITPLRRESWSVASVGVATFHDDSQDVLFKLDRVPSRRESLQLDQLKSLNKRSFARRRNGGSADSNKSFTSSWQSSLGSSLSSIFSSVRSLNIVVLDDEEAEDHEEHTFPRLGRRHSVNKENSARQMQLQWQRTEESAGGLQPKIPKRRASWGWKKSSLHSNATSSAGTKSRRSSLRSSLTSWTPSRSRRSSSGSITTQSPPLVNQHLLQLNSGGEQDTFPLRPWRRASLTSIGIPVERIVEGGELEEQGSSNNFSLGLSNHSHRQPPADDNAEDDNNEGEENEAPAPRCSETTQKIANAAVMWEEEEWPLEEPKLIARASAATVKATNSVDSSKSSRYHRQEDGLMRGDDGVLCRWAGGNTAANREEQATISIPIRLESAHTISTDC